MRAVLGIFMVARAREPSDAVSGERASAGVSAPRRLSPSSYMYMYTHELRHAAPGRPTHTPAPPSEVLPTVSPFSLWAGRLPSFSLTFPTFPSRGLHALGGAASPERSAYGARARASPCLVHALRASRVLDAWRAVDIIPPSSAAARRRLETRDPSRLACLHAHRAAFFPACLFLPCAAAAPCCLRSPVQAAARSA